MTCTKCGGKIIVDTTSANIEIESDNLNIELVGKCEDCEHLVLVGCEGTMEIISNHYLER